MESEQLFILSCISAFIKQESVPQPDDRIDMEKVFLLAQEQDLEGIVYSCCKSWIVSSNAGRPFINGFLRDVFSSINRTAMLREITNCFSEKKIPFVCIKGAVFRDYYPVSELRSMGDIDIVIRPEDRKAVDYIMREKLGYSRFVDNHAVWTYYLKDSPYYFEIEIHDHMFYEHLANHVDYRSYFDHVWEHCHKAPVFGIDSDCLFVPDDGFHFLYLMTHTAKHVINKGSGFRAFMDMVLMEQHCNLDWDWLEKELEKLEILTFTRKSFALSERWFGIRMPLGEKRLNSAFYREITDKTFRDGVFGLENNQNTSAHAAKEIKRSKGSYLRGAVHLTIRKVFPPYRDMQLIPWYAWVDGKPWLMPAAWVYRWFYCIKNKRKKSVELFAESFANRRIIKKREALIRSWGL